VARQATPLTAAGCERRHGNAHRHTGTAAVAMRAVEDVARAAESPQQCLRIRLSQSRIVGIEHQVARHAVGPVAASVIAGMEQSQVVVIAHCHVEVVTVPAYRRPSLRLRPASVRWLNPSRAGSTGAPDEALTVCTRRWAASEEPT